MPRDIDKTVSMMLAITEYVNVLKKVSACDRARYAAVLTTPDLRIVAHGYNGPASGLPNQCLRPDYDKECETCNGTGLLASASEGLSGSAFVKKVPCKDCEGRKAETGVVVHGCGCLHAEDNAVSALRLSNYQGPVIAFITGEPCEMCTMRLINKTVDCRMVVYQHPSHRKYGGTELLDRMNIPHGSAVQMARIYNQLGGDLPKGVYRGLD